MKTVLVDDEAIEYEEVDDFIHLVDTDELVSEEELLGENLEDTLGEEEDLDNWSLTTCPKCRSKFDLTKCRTSGENIICPTCYALL